MCGKDREAQDPLEKNLTELGTDVRRIGELNNNGRIHPDSKYLIMSALGQTKINNIVIHVDPQ